MRLLSPIQSNRDSSRSEGHPTKRPIDAKRRLTIVASIGSVPSIPPSRVSNLDTTPLVVVDLRIARPRRLLSGLKPDILDVACIDGVEGSGVGISLCDAGEVSGDVGKGGIPGRGGLEGKSVGALYRNERRSEPELVSKLRECFRIRSLAAVPLTDNIDLSTCKEKRKNERLRK
jgi:hypothetical protein